VAQPFLAVASGLEAFLLRAGNRLPPVDAFLYS
jgi:hypothetical protein